MMRHQILRLPGGLSPPPLNPFPIHLHLAREQSRRDWSSPGKSKEKDTRRRLAGAVQRRLRSPKAKTWAGQYSPPAYLRMHSFVLLQAHRVPEGLAAYLACKGSGATVRPAHVHLEPMRSGEHLRRGRQGEGG